MDNVVLYGPGGASPLNIGSWLEAYTGQPNYGAQGIVKYAFSDSVLPEGGFLSNKRYDMRQMQFPLIIPSNGAWQGLLGAESMLRLNSQPGGYIDVQPDGVASAEAIRFNILGGAFEEQYSTPIFRVGRMKGSGADHRALRLRPTEIIPASAALNGVTGGLSEHGSLITCPGH
jgi:hypothetical protein